MKNLVIIGAGDFAREVAWLVTRINAQQSCWNLLGFVDDAKAGLVVDNLPVLGSVEWLVTYPEELYVTCAISSGSIRQHIWSLIMHNQNLHPATLIDPTAIIGSSCTIGPGSIVCAGTTLTINATLGINCILNLNCTLGHDTVLDNFCTLHPSVNISGRVHLNSCCVVGTGSQIIQGLNIHEHTILGAGSVVTKSISTAGTYVGAPARKIK